VTSLKNAEEGRLLGTKFSRKESIVGKGIIRFFELKLKSFKTILLSNQAS
jgi:hypothetical protein